MDWLREHAFDIFLGFLALLVVAVLGLLIYLMVLEMTSPTFTLRKDEWHCINSHLETHLQPMQTGKITTLIPITDEVCTEYQKIDK